MSGKPTDGTLTIPVPPGATGLRVYSNGRLIGSCVSAVVLPPDHKPVPVNEMTLEQAKAAIGVLGAEIAVLSDAMKRRADRIAHEQQAVLTLLKHLPHNRTIASRLAPLLALIRRLMSR